MEGLQRPTSHLIHEFLTTPWALMPDVLAQMRLVLYRWASGVRLSAEEIEAAVGDTSAAAERAQPKPGSVAILPVMGILAQRSHVDASSNFIQGVDPLRRAFRSFVEDASVGAIVLDIDSPGGSVFGVQEFADEILAARGEKKVIAVADSVVGSAAYWIASAAEELVVAPSGQVGSIGVYAAHENVEKHLEELGVEVTLVSAGKYKVEGNPFEALGDEAREQMQRTVDDYYSAFVSAVAKGRGVKTSEVRGGFGEGRMVAAKEAVAGGMADRIGTLDETVARLSASKRAQRPRSRAENQIRLRERA